MDLEYYVFGILPLIIAVTVILIVANVLRQTKELITLVVGTIMIIFNVFSIYMLIQIILGAWPTNIPYILILITLVLLPTVVKGKK